MIDYYYILQQSFSQDERAAIRSHIKALNITQTAGAVMWVLNKALGLDSSKFIIEPNESYGQFLLKEIMLTGNMGKLDSRFSYTTNASKISRRLYLMGRYPGEMVWSPILSFNHFIKGFFAG